MGRVRVVGRRMKCDDTPHTPSLSVCPAVCRTYTNARPHGITAVPSSINHHPMTTDAVRIVKHPPARGQPGAPFSSPPQPNLLGPLPLRLSPSPCAAMLITYVLFPTLIHPSIQHEHTRQPHRTQPTVPTHAPNNRKRLLSFRSDGRQAAGPISAAACSADGRPRVRVCVSPVRLCCLILREFRLPLVSVFGRGAECWRRCCEGAG
ncbi:hypothetical protein HDK64DRAFT_46426 [Phyllosticta capitalensis]